MRVLNNALATIGILCCWVVTPTWGQSLLDLTTPEVEQIESRPGGCGGGGRLAGGEGGPPPLPELRLSLTIEHLDTETLKVGDEVVAELKFRNIGKEPQRFPLSSRGESAFGVNCEDLPQRQDGYPIRGIVALEFKDESGYLEPYIALHALYANSRYPESFRFLAPGETIRVKMGGKIFFNRVNQDRKPQGPPFKLPQQFVVTATFNLDDRSLWNPYKELRSSNQIRVRVTAPE